MKITQGKHLLLLIYVVLVAIVAFRIAVHPTNYTTHDSDYYIQQSENIENILRSDNTLSQLANIKSGFSTWPIGYPLSIGIVSYITTANPLIASKIVNLIFLGLLFLLFYKWQGEKAWFLTLPFFSYGSLEVVSETWSETPFIFFVFLLVFIISKSKKYSAGKLTLTISICLICLFLFRYVGVIYVAITGMLGIHYFIKEEKVLASSLFGSVLISTIFILLYLYTNKLSTGYLTGMARIEVGHESALDFVLNLSKGLLNELFIARNYPFNGTTPDWLFIVLMILQALVIFILIRKRKWIKTPLEFDSTTQTLLLLSLGYLAGITFLKVLIPIDDFDFRILFPFTVPLFVALLSIITSRSQKEYFDRILKVILLFMVLSLLVNLPKKYLITKVRDEFSQQKH